MAFLVNFSYSFIFFLDSFVSSVILIYVYYVLRAILPKFKNMIIFLLKIAAYTFHVGKYRMCLTEKTKRQTFCRRERWLNIELPTTSDGDFQLFVGTSQFIDCLAEVFAFVSWFHIHERQRARFDPARLFITVEFANEGVVYEQLDQIRLQIGAKIWWESQRHFCSAYQCYIRAELYGDCFVQVFHFRCMRRFVRRCYIKVHRWWTYSTTLRDF